MVGRGELLSDCGFNRMSDLRLHLSFQSYNKDDFFHEIEYGNLSSVLSTHKKSQATISISQVVFGGPVPGLEKNRDWTGPGLVRTGNNEPEKTTDCGPVLGLIYFWHSTDRMTTGHDRFRDSHAF